VLPVQAVTPAPATQRKTEGEEPLQAKFEIQRKENRTGLPDGLKAGIENLSGLAMDDVKVHYNSSAPAEVHALAFTRGTDIYVGPGREEHLAHEAWHVAQQKQGRVKPTLQAKGVAINDDSRLETEADVKGAQAKLLGNNSSPMKIAVETGAFGTIERLPTSAPNNAPLQLLSDSEVEAYMPVKPFNASFASDHIVASDTDFTDTVARTRRGSKPANTILRMDESQGKEELKTAIKDLKDVDEETVVNRNYLWDTQNSYKSKTARGGGSVASGDSKHKLGMILVENEVKRGGRTVKELEGIKITHYERSV
jgi:hypothetical protein